MAGGEDVEMEIGQDYNPAIRNAELEKICTVTEFLYNKFYKKKITDDDIVDLDESCQISGVFHTLYSFLRKKANANQANVGNLGGERSVNINNVIATISVTAEELKKDKPNLAFDFKIATPLVDTLTSFKCMWDEVRLSCATFTMKINGINKSCNIKEFGLDNAAIPRLRGITWKPERRSGMIKSMGPLTLALMLASETKYTEKTERALLNSISILPMAPHIVKCLKEIKEPAKSNGLLPLLNTTLMLIGNRSAHKIHFPLLFFAKCFRKDNATALTMNFSGTAGMLFYHKMYHEFVWKKKSGAFPEKIAQIVFHSIFGSSMEDLGILAQVTTLNRWEQRKNLSDVFIRASEAESKAFTPITFRYVSKLAAANLVKNAGTITPQLDCDNLFSGHRKRTFSEAFLGFVDRGNRGMAYSEEIGSLTYALKAFKDSLVQEARQGLLTEVGTTGWMEIVNNTLRPCNLVVNGTNTFFYA